MVWPPLAIGVVLVIFTPPALFGVGYIADRMPLFAALVFVAAMLAGMSLFALQERCRGAKVAAKP